MKSSNPSIKQSKPSLLKVDDYIVNGVDPISILVVGAGGNGSLIVNNIARMATVLSQVHRKTIEVTLYDDDIVTEANMGRQLFSPADVGLHKSSVVITRLNRFFGTSWQAKTMKFLSDSDEKANIIISATDNVSSRREIEKWFYRPISAYNNRHHKYYWIDCGNGKDFGNVILADHPHKLPCIFDLGLSMDETESGPSCSLAEAIGRQDMFVNSWVALAVNQLLWELLTKSNLSWHGMFFNLQTLQFAKRPIIYHESKTRPKRKSKTAH